MATSVTDATRTPAAAASVANHFAELFPPLVPKEPSVLERELEVAQGAVDLSVGEITLRPLEQEVEVHLYEALRRWNKHVAASGEATMPYMQRLRKYRAIVRWMLYENEDPHRDDEGTVVEAATSKDPSPGARRRLAKQQQKTRRKEIATFKEIFSALPPITTLRELRRPSARLEKFLERFPPKKRLLSSKRSVADTQTSMCFEFARRPIPVDMGQGAHATPDAANDENAVPGDRGTEIQRPTVTTAATWRSRTLLASMEEHQRKTGTTTEQSAVQVGLPSHNDLVLWIEVLHSSKDPARTQSFLMLGSHTISDLLDRVACAYDQRFESHGRHAKLLYFDRQFYVDRRHAENADYSTEIKAWILAKPLRIAKYLGSPDQASVTPKPMESTAIAELALKIDTPGVYIHQGECEHLVRLRDVRLLNPETDDPDNCPLRLPNPHKRNLRSCLVCSNYSAKFVCYGDRMASTDPMFYCDRCFRAAHYDRNGNLLFTDFQAFQYIQE